MPSGLELIDRARALAPEIAARAQTTEAQRRPHDDTISALIDARLMEILVPRRFGGHELNVDTMAGVVRAVSRACGSSGWIAAFYIGHNWMATKFSEAAQEEIFAERPFGLIPAQTSPAGMHAKRVAGGYELSGRASWSSGIMHADWVIAGGVADGSDAGPATFLLPIEDVRVDDVWHMSGMAGTGSNDVIFEEAFVPDHRAITGSAFVNGITEGSAIHDNPLYAMPLLPFIYTEAIGVFVGELEGATADYDSLVRNRVTTFGQAVLAEKQATHIQLGEAHARGAAAGTLFDRLVADTMALQTGAAFSLDDRLRLKLNAGYIADHCRETHAFWDWGVCRELYGRHLLGLPPNHPLI
jgi:alkylation response protein AidB-like acyl-CoA dehydrogenase